MPFSLRISSTGSGPCTTSAMNLPAWNSVTAVATKLAVEIRVYSPCTPVSAVKAFMIGSTAVMLA